MTQRFSLERVPDFTPDGSKQGAEGRTQRQLQDALNVSQRNFQKLERLLLRAIEEGGLIADGTVTDAMLAARYLYANGSRALTGNWLNGDSYGVQLPWLQLSTTFADGSAEGRLQWNSEDGAPEIGLPGGNVNLQIGQEFLTRVKNTSGADIADGSVVYPTGATGGRMTIGLADASDPLKSHAIALTTEPIDNNQFGYVTLIGLVRGLDTSAFSDGDVVYLSDTTPGDYATAAPAAPSTTLEVGFVVSAHATEGSIIVYPHVHERILEASDVLGGSPTDGQTLAWVAANSRFELATPSGGTPPTDFDLLTDGVDSLVFAAGDVVWIL